MQGVFRHLDRPATVLVDLPVPNPEVARRLKDIDADVGVLFLVRSYELAEILPLLGAGASGCVSRDATVGDLAGAIIAAGRGEIVLPPVVAARALAALARGEPVGAGPSEPLSERESEVLRLLARGLTNKDIAQTLFLSVRTVEAHLRSIFAKLGVRSRTEAALWAIEHGYGSGE
jgi:NarL family two-component system response regulator LiaR